jgi:hypothetical protein
MSEDKQLKSLEACLRRTIRRKGFVARKARSKQEWTNGGEFPLPNPGGRWFIFDACGELCCNCDGLTLQEAMEWESDVPMNELN